MGIDQIAPVEDRHKRKGSGKSGGKSGESGGKSGGKSTECSCPSTSGSGAGAGSNTSPSGSIRSMKVAERKGKKGKKGKNSKECSCDESPQIGIIGVDVPAPPTRIAGI